MENIKRLRELVEHIEKEAMDIKKEDRELKSLLTETGLCSSLVKMWKIIEEESEKRGKL